MFTAIIKLLGEAHDEGRRKYSHSLLPFIFDTNYVSTFQILIFSSFILSGIVHGDIRAFNLVFGEDDSHIIDWDLAQEEDKGKYPDGFNVSIPDGERHPDAYPGQSMKKAHDWFALAAVMRLMPPVERYMRDTWEEITTAVENGVVDSLHLDKLMPLHRPQFWYQSCRP